ncbi:SpoIIE family protein phosphatase [Fluviicola sp.]|uniref:SpoIIE family protein phosphatase n=1 Tax=Fluviicola sp. TaxID=1917219 RepID=UPI0031DD8D0C
MKTGSVLALLFTLFIQTTFVCAQEIELIDKLRKQEYPKKIEQSSGDQKIAYEYIYLRLLNNSFKKELPAYQKKFAAKKDEKHLKLLHLFELSTKENTPEKLEEIRRFTTENQSITLVHAFGKYHELKTLGKLDMHPEVLVLGEKNMPLFKKYKEFPLSDIYSAMGISAYMMGDTRKSIYTFEKSVDYMDTRDSSGIAGSLMNLGVINFRTGNNAKAIEAYKRADRMNGNIDMPLKGMINENLAISYSNYGKTDIAMDYYDKAADIYLQIKDTTKYNALIQNKIGEYIQMKDFESAIKCAKSSMAFFKKTKNTRMLPNSHIKLASIYIQLKDTVHALREINEAIRLSKGKHMFTYVSAVFEKSDMLPVKKGLRLLLDLEKELIEKKYDGENSTLYCKIGVCYKQMNQLDPAEKYFRKAIEAESKKTPPNPDAMTGYNQNLGVVYFDRKDFAKALKAYQEADKYQDLKYATGQHIADRYLLYANVYGKLGKYQLAYENLNAHKRVQDSLDALTLNDKILSLKQEFQTQQIEDSLNINKKELSLSNLKIISEKATNQRNTSIIFGMLIVLVLIFGLVILIARSNKQRKLANLTLTEKNAEIEAQQVILQQKNDEIIDSINYAKRLQNTILPPQAKIDDLFPKNFVLYKPKDIVAGDFYVCESIEMAGRKIGIVAVADCTGHGVPGALVSMVCSSAIKRSVTEFNLTDPGKILDKSAQLVVESFESAHENVKDGMDISLACIDFSTNTMKWAGAHNPLWIIRNKELIEIKADKQPVGHFEHFKSFTSHEIILEPMDRLYFISDGFADQFGGPIGKKLKTKNLKEFLVATSGNSITQQASELERYFTEWKANFEQVDDVCIMGIEI